MTNDDILKLDLSSLYKIKSDIKYQMLSEGKNYSSKKKLRLVNEAIKLLKEDDGGSGGVASVTQGTTSGMGDVVSAQPSSIPGVTTEPGYSQSGGTVGSGDVSFPFPAIGGKRMLMGFGKDNNTPQHMKKKKRKPQFDINTVTKSDELPKSKVMNYQDFIKADVNKIKRD